MKKKAIITIVCIGITGLIIFKLITNKKKIDEKNQPVQIENIRIPVTTTIVKEGVQEAGLVKTGKLTPYKEAKIIATSSGNIQRLLFNLGDNINQGQVIAIIDTRLIKLDLQKAESNVSKLKRDLQTYSDLLEGNATTQEKVNEIRQNYNDAINLSQQLRRQIADANIKAPISGIIGTKPIEEGVYITTGEEIASIVNLSQLKVVVYFTEAEVYQISLGQKINLTTDVYPDKSFFGRVTFISPQTNQSHNYLVEITAVNKQDAPLRSGTFVHADFSKKSVQKILLIPREALNESTQNASVYVVVKNKALLRSIKVGKEYGKNIQVIDGLRAGDLVVTSGQINLKDGTLINVSK